MKNPYKKDKDETKSLGISPLVAAVLLIAVTMTIAGLLAYWATSFVRTSLPETNQTEAECRFADFSIYSCAYNSSAQRISLILENLQDVEMINLKTFFIFPNSTVSEPILLNGTLPAGGMLKSFQMQNVAENFTKIMVTTHCSEVNKEKVCTIV